MPGKSSLSLNNNSQMDVRRSLDSPFWVRMNIESRGGSNAIGAADALVINSSPAIEISGGQNAPLGATPCGKRRDLQRLFSRRFVVDLFSSTDLKTMLGLHGVISFDPFLNRTYHYWHIFVPGCSRGRFTGYRVKGRSNPAAGCDSMPPRFCLTLTGEGLLCRTNYTREAGAEPGDNAAHGDEERGRGSERVRLGGRRAAAAVRPSRRSSMRCTCAGFTRHPNSGVAERNARHLCRTDRENPVPAGPRHHGCRIAAGIPVRCPRFSAGAGQLLGLCPDLVLRAAPGLQLAPRSARPGRRISRHGQGAAPGGHRGHPRCRLQPHRRGRPRGTDALLPRIRELDLLHSRAGPRRATQLHRHAAIRSTPTTRSCGG